MSIGLDIGSKTIKLVELEKVGEALALKSAGVVGYKGMVIDKMVEDKDFAELAGVLKKLFSDTKVSSKDVSVALPEAQVFTRAISFPLLTDQEVASAVKWEAEQYIPIPVAEAIIQHQIIERRETGNPPGVSVLLVASPRVLVEKYIKLLTMAGLNAVVVETELMALTRALAPANQTAILIDFGAFSSDLAIVKNGQLTLSRSIPTAGDAFTRAIAQNLGVSLAQAEEYKKTYGFATNKLEGKVGGALDPIFGVVTSEIKKAISFYQSEQKGESPTSIVLSGGTSGMPDATGYLTKSLGIEVVIGNPFLKVQVDPQTAKSLSSYAPLYAISVGLALRNE
jgi:type IV pilus assembly protein PilM